MTIIKSIEEITIFESPDGGRTVYSRKSGSSDRTLVSKDPQLILEEELAAKWAYWKDIIKLSKENSTLADAIHKVEMIYVLIKEQES
jgi:hypothetical protein